MDRKFLPGRLATWEAGDYLLILKNVFSFGCGGSLLLHGGLSRVGEWGYSLVACGLLTVVASPVAGHGLLGAGFSGV